VAIAVGGEAEAEERRVVPVLRVVRGLAAGAREVGDLVAHQSPVLQEADRVVVEVGHQVLVGKIELAPVRVVRQET
jgi:hypothetical protein